MKKKARQLLAALLALSTLFLALPALAGAGDITIYRPSEDGSYESMRAVILSGETLYIFTYGDNYYTWTHETGELVTHTFDQTAINRDDGGYNDLRTIVAAADGMYALVIANDPTGADDGSTEVGAATLCPVEFADDGTATLGEGVELDWDDMVQYYDEYDYSREVRYPFVSGNTLTFFTYGDGGESNEIFAFDMETGDCELYETESDDSPLNIQSYCAYKDGMGLIASYNYSGDSEPVVFYTIDLATGDVAPAFEIPVTGYAMPTNLLYDEKTDMFYYTSGGQLMRMSGFDPATIETVAAVQIDSWSELQPALTDDGYFICSDYQTVIARSTDPSARAARTLTVYTGYNQALEGAYYTFAAKHTDTDVVLTQNYTDITEAMMNQSTAVDLYTVQVNTDDYGALYDRGYLAELTSDSLSSLVAEMYPDIQTAVTKDGQLLALPVEMYTGNSMSYNPKALEKLGLAEDDMPKTWVGLFQFLQKLPELAGDTGVQAFDSYMTQSDARLNLFYSMLSAYMLYIKKTDGAEMAFDTAILNEALDEFEKIDFAALGLPEEYDDNSYSYDEDSRSKILFQNYADISPSSYRDEYAMPMLLSFEDGAQPMIEVYLTVAFVNPYSPNRDLAIEYLEDAAADLNATFLVTACPGRNDPIKNAYYDESLSYYQDQIDSIKAELEKADEEAKADWQTQLDQWEGYLADFEEYGAWDASAESIARYREYANYMVVSEYFGMDDSNSGEFYDQIQQYLDGTIDKATMLKNIDKKLKMMLQEGM